MAICICTECKNVFITRNESENVAVCPKCGKSADILSESNIKEHRDEIYLSALHKKQVALYPRDLYEARELFSALGTYRDTPDQIESCDYLAKRLEERERAEDESLTFAPKKVKKALKITLAVVLSLAFIISAMLLLTSPIKYAMAKSSFEKGNYDRAAELFSEIADFSDSKDFLKEIYAHFSEKEGRVVSCSALEPYFEINAAGAISFIRSSYSGDGNIVIPAVFDGVEVDSIARNAFKNYTKLKTVEIPDSVTSVNDYAFYGCSSVESIELPENLDTIAQYAFTNCTSLRSINIPSAVKAINKNTFAGCSSLMFPTLPDSLTKIDTSAFMGCTSFEKVTLPMNVNKIAPYAFSDCSALSEITFSNQMTEIGESAFYGCGGLTSVIYMGTADEYKNIKIKDGNEALTKASVEYAAK